MALIFNRSHVGATVQLPSGSQPAAFSLVHAEGTDGGALGTRAQQSIITGWNYEENVNVQFTHTMGSDIYLNIFGNRMGILSLTGLSFAAESDGTQCNSSKHGIEHIIAWYRANRVSNPLANKVNVTIGSDLVVTGYITGSSYRAQDTESWLVQYTIQVAVIPK